MVTLLILLVTPAQAVSDECGEGLCPVVEDLNLVLASTPSTAEAGEAEEEELLPASRTGQKVYDANLERVQEAQYKVTDVQY